MAAASLSMAGVAANFTLFCSFGFADASALCASAETGSTACCEPVDETGAGRMLLPLLLPLLCRDEGASPPI